MVGFEYQYNTLSEIFPQMQRFSEMGILDYLIGTLIVTLYIGLIFYGLPYYHILTEYLGIKKEEKERKNFLKQIVLQKDIEDEIEKELEI